MAVMAIEQSAHDAAWASAYWEARRADGLCIIWAAGDWALVGAGDDVLARLEDFLAALTVRPGGPTLDWTTSAEAAAQAVFGPGLVVSSNLTEMPELPGAVH